MTELEFERWSEIFRANNINLRLGITLDVFLQNPEAILQAVVFNMPLPLENGKEFYDLLPRQLRLALSLVLKDALDNKLDHADDHGVMAEMIEMSLLSGAHVVHRDNRYVEPMHHHRYNSSQERDARRIAR